MKAKIQLCVYGQILDEWAIEFPYYTILKDNDERRLARNLYLMKKAAEMAVYNKDVICGNEYQIFFTVESKMNKGQ